MPRYLKQNGKRVPNVVTHKTWMEVPVKTAKNDGSVDMEVYLLPPRVVDYIEKLEKIVGKDLPKLSRKL